MFPIAIYLTLCPILQPLYYATHTLSLTTIYWQTELNLENIVELLQKKHKTSTIMKDCSSFADYNTRIVT